MILGMGLDLCSIERLRRALRIQGFRERVFSEEEIAYVADRRNPEASLAACFAAKEAFAKAFGTGVRPPVLLPAIAISHDEQGKPVFEFHGQLAEIVENRQLTAHLSISDEADYAIAYVLLEQA